MANKSGARQGGIKRSATSGRFLSGAAAARWPATTVASRTGNEVREAADARTASATPKAPSASPDVDPITPEQRAAAARIRVAYDKKRGRQTEAWIKRLAG